MAKIALVFSIVYYICVCAITFSSCREFEYNDEGLNAFFMINIIMLLLCLLGVIF